MHDKRLVDLKLRAERDRKLSDGAFRLLCCLVSDRYLSRDRAEDEFDLPWSLVKVWTWVERKMARARIQALIQNGYLFPRGLHGCPARMRFSLALSCLQKEATGRVEKEATGSLQKEATSRPEKGATSCLQKEALLYCTPPSEEETKTRGKKSSGEPPPVDPPPTSAGSQANHEPRPIAELIRNLRAAVDKEEIQVSSTPKPSSTPPATTQASLTLKPETSPASGRRPAQQARISAKYRAAKARWAKVKALALANEKQKRPPKRAPRRKL